MGLWSRRGCCQAWDRYGRNPNYATLLCAQSKLQFTKSVKDRVRILTNYIVITKAVILENDLFGHCFNSFLRLGPKASINISALFWVSNFDTTFGNPMNSSQSLLCFEFDIIWLWSLTELSVYLSFGNLLSIESRTSYSLWKLFRSSSWYIFSTSSWSMLWAISLPFLT